MRLVRQAVVADDRLGRFAQFVPGMRGVRLARVEHDGHQRKLGLVQLQPLAGPVVGEALVQPLEQCTAPGGILARRVVANQIMVRRCRRRSPGGSSASSCLASASRRKRLKRLVVGMRETRSSGSTAHSVPSAGQEQQAAICGRDQHLARRSIFPARLAQRNVVEPQRPGGGAEKHQERESTRRESVKPSAGQRMASA